MTKTEIINAVAEKNSISKKDAGTYVDSVLDTMVDTLTKGDKVSLVGFGTFEVHDSPERIGHNPRTKEEITIPATKRPVFKASKNFKEKVRK